MQDFSPVDGFMDVKEGVDEMIKNLANEPSVGLFFVQQHAHTSMPYLLGVKDKIMEEIHEVTLHTEDIEDSIQVLNSMSECGLPIAIDMIQDINRSLRIMSTSQPKKGLIQNPMSGFHTDRSNSNLSADFNYNARSIHEDGKSGQSYISTFFNSAKQKVAGVKWAQANKGPSESIRCEPHASHSATELDIHPNLVNADAELPLSSHSVNDKLEEPVPNIRISQDDIPFMFEPFDKFSSDQEAKLEKWLREA